MFYIPKRLSQRDHMCVSETRVFSDIGWLIAVGISQNSQRAQSSKDSLRNVTVSKCVGPPTMLGRRATSNCFIWNANMYTRRSDPSERKLEIRPRPTRLTAGDQLCAHVCVTCRLIIRERRGEDRESDREWNLTLGLDAISNSSLSNWMRLYSTEVHSYGKTSRKLTRKRSAITV